MDLLAYFPVMIELYESGKFNAKSCHTDREQCIRGNMINGPIPFPTHLSYTSKNIKTSIGRAPPEAFDYKHGRSLNYIIHREYIERKRVKHAMSFMPNPYFLRLFNKQKGRFEQFLSKRTHIQDIIFFHNDKLNSIKYGSVKEKPRENKTVKYFLYWSVLYWLTKVYKERKETEELYPVEVEILKQLFILYPSLQDFFHHLDIEEYKNISLPSFPTMFDIGNKRKRSFS